MIAYPNNVKRGDVVHDSVIGTAYDVTDVKWRKGKGWEATTKAVDGYSGPTFNPHPDRMPSPDTDFHAQDIASAQKVTIRGGVRQD